MLEGERPHVIDEWQRAPGIWNAVRHAVDAKRGMRGVFILTGSSTPLAEGEKQWDAIEVKTSEEKTNEGLATLRRLKRKLTANPASRVRPPEFVTVVVGISEFAREVGDCAYVLPIRCLGA